MGLEAVKVYLSTMSNATLAAPEFQLLPLALSVRTANGSWLPKIRIFGSRPGRALPPIFEKFYSSNPLEAVFPHAKCTDYTNYHYY